MVDGAIHDRHLIAIRRSDTMARRKPKSEAEKTIDGIADELARKTVRGNMA